jgi:hypothetical protein
VKHDLALLIQDAERHGPGIHVAATVNWVVVGGEAPEVASSPSLGSPHASILPWEAEEGASIRINEVESPAKKRGGSS